MNSRYLMNLISLALLVFVQGSISSETLFKSVKNYFHKSVCKVGLLSIHGVITDASQYIADLQYFFGREDVEAILMSIESGGGAAGSSQAIYEEIIRYKQTNDKPVIVWIPNVCASGAYYIAMAADLIISTRSAIVGSIGCYISRLQYNGLLERFNVYPHIIYSGDFKTSLNELTTPTPEQIKHIQELADSCARQFISDAKLVRPILAERDEAEWAGGKIFTGEEAEKLGLIDGVGSPTFVENSIREMLKTSNQIEYVHAPRPSIIRMILGGANNQQELSLINRAVAAVLAQLRIDTPTIEASLAAH